MSTAAAMKITRIAYSEVPPQEARSHETHSREEQYERRNLKHHDHAKQEILYSSKVYSTLGMNFSAGE